METGVINIHGKSYKTVALRVSEFRGDHPIEKEWAILTEIVDRTEKDVVVKASIVGPAGKIVATGFAEEMRAASQINRTSALENAETSAIGRALANAGLAGSEYASANEVENAIHQQSQPAKREPPAAKEPPEARPSESESIAAYIAGCQNKDQLLNALDRIKSAPANQRGVLTKSAWDRWKLMLGNSREDLEELLALVTESSALQKTKDQYTADIAGLMRKCMAKASMDQMNELLDRGADAAA